MLSRRARIAVASLALVALSLADPIGAARGPAPDSSDLRELRERIEKLKNEIAAAEESRNEARDALKASEHAISEANRALRELAQERQSTRAEIARLEEQTRQVESELGSRRQDLGRVLSWRYFGSQTGHLRLLLSGVNPNQTARELHYYSYISRAQSDSVRSLQAALASLKDLQQRTSEKSHELAAIEAEQKKARDLLSREKTARSRVLEKVSTRLREHRREVRNLERDEARLSRLIAELSRVIADRAKKASPIRRNDPIPAPNLDEGPATTFARLKGLLRLPVRGELVGRYGSPRPDGGPSWKGLFIRAAAGQEVRAVAAGRVVFADWMRGFGNLLILDHGQDYLTIYGNNESVLKRLGDTVRAGEAVATIGASGGSAESGLYFEMRHAGRPFDPLTWVTSR